MAPVEVGTNGRINGRSLHRLAAARRVSGDDNSGSEGSWTTRTTTFVETRATGGITIDHATT